MSVVVTFDAPSAYFGSYGFASMPQGVYSVTLADGVTGATGDGNYEVIFTYDELAVFGVGNNAPALHCVKLPTTGNQLVVPFDFRNHKLNQYLVVNGSLVGQRELRVLGGVGPNNFGPGQGGAPGNGLPGSFVTTVNTRQGDIIILGDGSTVTITEGPTNTFTFKAIAVAAPGGGGTTTGGAMLPLVNGDLPGPSLVADSLGQCIGVSL